ncbi:MAG: response regulator [Aquabacterium sp.]|jgi:DNA-binding NarL/FixJ family response regulator
MSPKAPHLLLVDDHALFRMGLGQMLAAHWPDARLQQAVSWTGAMTQLATVHPADAFDVMLLDVGLPDADALQALPEVQRLAPGLPVLVMSADSRPERVARAREAGARGWVSKSAQPALIVAALQAVMHGDMAFAGLDDAQLSPAAGVLPAAPRRPPATLREPFRLDEQQSQILRLLGRDVPNKAIAKHLGLSETEVRVQVSWLTDMLEATSRREAYARAVELGVLTP